ncbi:MAG: hypothetical protein H6737_13020 [Alphaproteobacteria bacterium]|nr:hypothetical protein [Alphaproteobacteria bacterium]
MIAWLLAAFAAPPTTVVTFDNGGFNLPLYTPRWNGRFAQPSVAQQLASDIARLQGHAPRVFTYLPPGPVRGRSSDPFEVFPKSSECSDVSSAPEEGSACWCPPGDRCWSALDLNRDPGASTSLYQAALAIRGRVDGPRVEIHFTDLFEEDPTSAENPADADRCVTKAGTQKALEALMRPVEGSLDHVAVGLLRARVDPPQGVAGGVVRFTEEDGGCWTAARIRTFGGGGEPLEVAMGVVLLGIDTAPDDDEVRRLVRDLERQISEPLSLELVTVREPPTQGRLAAGSVPAEGVRLALGEAPARSTPCDAVTTSVSLESGPESVSGRVDATCDSLGSLYVSRSEVSRVFNLRAGLDPTFRSVDLSGTVHVRGTSEPVRAAVERLAARQEGIDRPLPFWPYLVAALRFEAPDGVWRPREHYVVVEGVTVTGADDRPWGMAGMFAFLIAAGFTLFVYILFGRFAANRAFRRHLGAASASGRPIAAVLAEASEEARAGWFLRLVVALGIGLTFGLSAALVLLLFHGALVG